MSNLLEEQKARMQKLAGIKGSAVAKERMLRESEDLEEDEQLDETPPQDMKKKYLDEEEELDEVVSELEEDEQLDETPPQDMKKKYLDEMEGEPEDDLPDAEDAMSGEPEMDDEMPDMDMGGEEDLDMGDDLGGADMGGMAGDVETVVANALRVAADQIEQGVEDATGAEMDVDVEEEPEDMDMDDEMPDMDAEGGDADLDDEEPLEEAKSNVDKQAERIAESILASVLKGE